MFRFKSAQKKMNFQAKRIAALLGSASLVASGLVAGVASPANAAPVTKMEYANIYRQVTNNEFTLKANETLSAALRSSVSTLTSDGVKQLSSNLEVTPGISGVTYGSKGYSWSIRNNGPGAACSQSVMTATVTPCASATEVSYSVFQNLTNTTGSPITITTNKATAQLTYGTDVVAGVTNNMDASRYVGSSSAEMTSGLVIGSGDTSFSGEMILCFDSAQVAVGDVLTVQKSVAINGTAIADTFHQSNPYVDFFRNGRLEDFTLTSPLPTQTYVQLNAGNLNSTPGTLAISVDLKKAGVSVLTACPTVTPPPSNQVSLFSLGGATVSGTFAVGQVITATPNSWSRTNGGATVSTTNGYNWLVCTMAQTTSTTSPANVPCIAQEASYQYVLAGGNSIGGVNNGQNVFYSAATLTVTENLLNLLNGKYLMVIARGTAANPTARSFVFMQTCGPISAGSTCSVAFGTAAPVVTTPGNNNSPGSNLNTPAPSASAPTAVTTPAVGTAAALAALPKSTTQPKLKFDSSANGLGKSAKKSLKKVADVAKDGYGVRVTGAAGMQPGVSREAVRALAKKRAMEIRAYLIKQGVPKEDIVIRTKVFPIGKAPATLVKVETIN